jgi:hypothetical protein
MAIHFGANGDKENKGNIVVTESFPGCSLFVPSDEERRAEHDRALQQSRREHRGKPDELHVR